MRRAALHELSSVSEQSLLRCRAPPLVARLRVKVHAEKATRPCRLAHTAPPEPAEVREHEVALGTEVLARLSVKVQLATVAPGRSSMATAPADGAWFPLNVHLQQARGMRNALR